MQSTLSEGFMGNTVANYEDIVRAMLLPEEGRTNYMYLDNRRVNGLPAPLVTIGIGCAVPVTEVTSLEFVLGDRPATASEILSDYHSLLLAPFGRKAPFYEPLTKVRLTDREIEALIEQRFADFSKSLHTIFPDFYTYPETAKAGCLELIYGLGAAGLAAPHYPMFRKAVQARDWNTAAEQCGSNTSIDAYDKRNAARKALFLQAAKDDYHNTNTGSFDEGDPHEVQLPNV